MQSDEDGFGQLILIDDDVSVSINRHMVNGVQWIRMTFGLFGPLND